jgi:hypothetical protein
MCELTFITEIQDLQRKIPITVKLITCEQAMWLDNGKKMLQIESKKSVFNNNNNISYLSEPWILDTSSLKEKGPRFWTKDAA